MVAVITARLLTAAGDVAQQCLRTNDDDDDDDDDDDGGG